MTNEPDLVGYINTPEITGWVFWDETRTFPSAAWGTEEEARAALREHVKMLDAVSIRRMPKSERDRIMEQAASLAADDYKDGGGLNVSDAFLDDALSTEEGCISVGGSSLVEEDLVQDILTLLCDYDGFYNRETETGNATELANLIDEVVGMLKCLPFLGSAAKNEALLSTALTKRLVDDNETFLKELGKEEPMTDTVKISVSFKETVEGVVYVTHALPDGVSKDEFLSGMMAGDRNVIGGAINQKWVELDTYNLELNLDSARIAEEETP